MKPQLRHIETTLEKIVQTSSLNHTAKKTNNKLSFIIQVNSWKNSENKGSFPSLPQLKPVPISNHLQAANPAFASSILTEIQTIVTGWQNELQRLQQQIQDLYLDGPIVDGWLESHTDHAETDFSLPSKTEQAQLRDYIEEISDSQVSYQTLPGDYQLCGLDPEGKLWSKPCPAEQVAEVSVAIARYQKLRQFLGRKQDLQKNLSELSETLMILHGNLTES